MPKNVAVFCLALACLAAPTAASTFVGLTDAELVAGADAVVQGKITNLQSRWSESGRILVTEATLKVQATLAGAAPGVVTVRTFGGTVGDFGAEAHGFPAFRPGEKVILFLENDTAGSARVLGYQQGHFEVVKRLDGVKLAVPRVENGRFLTKSGRLMPARPSIELRAFKRHIRRTSRQLERSSRR